MAKKQKYYVVWRGIQPGIYESWEECQQQVLHFATAKYKAFDSKAEALAAFADSDYELGKQEDNELFTQENIFEKPAKIEVMKAIQNGKEETINRAVSGGLILNALAVDAGCMGNPGKMEYQGVYVANGQRIFHFGPIYGTNNIGEFLAIVHGLALMKKQGLKMPIYSDSLNAMNWVKRKKCGTKLERNEKSEELFLLIERAEKWLRENTYDTPIIKWDKNLWGEIPADFGRK